MRIHDITIENFRGIEKQRFSFCEPGTDTPRPLSVLLGPNMSGKTTVLDALHLVFEVVSNLKDPKFRPDFNPSDPALRNDPSMPITIGLRFSIKPGERDTIDELNQILRTPQELPLSDIYEIQLHWPPGDGLTGIRNVLDSASPRGANFLLRGRALARLARAQRLSQEEVFERVGGMLYLDQHRSVTLAVPSTRTAPPEYLRDDARSRDVLPWLELQSRLDQKWDTATQGPSTWSRIKARFAELAAPSAIDDMKSSDEGFDLRFVQSGRYYYTAGLSYGQQQILRFVTNLAAFRAKLSVVLVDEIELHLHPTWQRRLVHFMRKGGGEDNQFIVTTHSESIASYLHPDEVVKLGEIDEPN